MAFTPGTAECPTALSRSLISALPQVAQVVAYTLGVPLEQVVVKASDTMVGANSFVTGGSFGTDLCAHVSARRACRVPLSVGRFISPLPSLSSVEM